MLGFGVERRLVAKEAGGACYWKDQGRCPAGAAAADAAAGRRHAVQGGCLPQADGGGWPGELMMLLLVVLLPERPKVAVQRSPPRWLLRGGRGEELPGSEAGPVYARGARSSSVRHRLPSDQWRAAARWLGRLVHN